MTLGESCADYLLLSYGVRNSWEPVTKQLRRGVRQFGILTVHAPNRRLPTKETIERKCRNLEL